MTNWQNPKLYDINKYNPPFEMVLSQIDPKYISCKIYDDENIVPTYHVTFHRIKINFFRKCKYVSVYYNFKLVKNCTYEELHPKLQNRILTEITENL